MFSCQKEDGLVSSIEETHYLSESDLEGMMKLGKQLQNPYSVENMRKAWENLKSNGRMAGEDVDITASHLYLRFTPRTEEELDILKADSTLVMYDYPLDFEIEEGGDFYHDPSVPIDQPTYQYMAVPVDKRLPDGVAYEVLAELFIPDEDLDGEASRIAGHLSVATIDALVDEALRMTNNWEEPLAHDEGIFHEHTNNARGRRCRWRPAGRIRVWDDNFNNHVALEGVEVRARRWFTTHTGIANSEGYYTCDGRFKRDANYSIRWERYHYSIRSGAVGQANLNGPKRRGDWYEHIEDNNIQQFYAFIHIGAYHYYYRDILGLSRPPLNSFWKPQMKIGGYNEEGRANHNDDRRLLGIRNQVRMYRRKDGNIVGSERLYNTTLHELAHASHWEFRKGNWDNGKTSGKLQESWAMGVAWSLTRLRYPTHNWWENVSFNWMETDGESQYTPLIIDLIDDNNQGNNSVNRPFDRVTGYTISEIEAVIGNSKNIIQLRNNLQSRYDKPTDGFLDELFEQYINLSR